MILEPTMVSTRKHALEMARIRNTCREFMTRDQSYIGRLQQLSWFKKTYLPANQEGIWTAWLFALGKEDDYVGFGMVRWVNEVSWLTGGLLPEWRGAGFGVELFTFLIEQAEPPIYVEVKSDNKPANALYQKLGFIYMSVEDGKFVMKL